ncbi:MAG: acyl carrier protein [Eubacteriales bacterium]
MIFEKIAELIAEKIDCPVEDITNETKFSDLGIDSLDLAELTMNLEDEYNITLEMSNDIATVADLVAKIEALTGEKDA